MPLPTFRCPVCRNALTLDVVFAHDGVREAILQLVNAHPEAGKLLRPLLAYVGLFAPAKTEMRYERVASILGELVPIVHAGTVRDANGQVWPAPLDYWRQAFDEVLARRDAGTLKLPLKSHGYLTAVVLGMSNKAASSAERRVEEQRAGHAGAGTPQARMQAVTVAEPVARAIPEHIRKDVLRAAGSRRANTIGDHQ